MKGPGMRLDLDVRRIWRCAVCGTERHTPGQVTFVRCHFCKEHPAMALVEPQRPHRDPPPPLDPILELHPDDVDAPAFVPVHLREPEPATPTETIEEILTEPPADEVEAAPSTAAIPVEEQDEDATETPGEQSPEESAPKKRKKKRRSRRQRRRNRSPQSEGDSASDQQSPSSPPAKSADSSGSGVVP